MMYQSTTKQPLESIYRHYRVLLIRYLTVLCLIPLSSPLIAEVDITTLDDFNIFSTSPHELIVNKQGQLDRQSFIAFKMTKPFCICANPVISLASDKEVVEGSKIKGTITVDMTKPIKTVLRVLQQFESGHLLLRPLNFPSLRSSRVIKVKTEHGTSETFLTKGIDYAMEQSKSMCESKWFFEDVEPKVEELSV